MYGTSYKMISPYLYNSMYEQINSDITIFSEYVSEIQQYQMIVYTKIVNISFSICNLMHIYEKCNKAFLRRIRIRKKIKDPSELYNRFIIIIRTRMFIKESESAISFSSPRPSIQQINNIEKLKFIRSRRTLSY